MKLVATTLALATVANAVHPVRAMPQDLRALFSARFPVLFAFAAHASSRPTTMALAALLCPSFLLI